MGDSAGDQGFQLIVGLGNPGKEYEETRHNIGFAVLEILALRLNVNFSKESKWDAHLARYSSSPGSELALMKPTTFMNLSGEAVGKYARFHRIPPAAALIVSDDVSLPLGTLRLRREGGAGGQKGLKSVLMHFATEQVPRLRVGVGGAEGKDLSDHVLSRFLPEERTPAMNAISRAADALLCVLNQGMDHAMNLYNANTAPSIINTTTKLA